MTSTEGALKGLIRNVRLVAFDFDGVFTDNMVYVFQDGTEMVRCYRGDGIGLRKLEKIGIRVVIISTETNPVVSVRSQKLGVECIQGCEDKRRSLQALIAEMGISPEQVAFVGNDINDLACLNLVGLPIVVKDAHQDLAPFARHRTAASGGCGAVREVCDLFERVLTENEASRP